jgi:hypothetical protein
MFLRSLRLPFLTACLALLAGCAAKPQMPVQLSPMALSAAPSQRVGIVMAAVPKASLELPGANCLLCVAAAQVANASIAKHFDTLDSGDLLQVRDRIAEMLRKKGVAVVILPDPLDLNTLAETASSTPNAAKRDFSPLKQKYGVDKLVVVSVEALGVQRSYSAYIPTGAPYAFLRAAGYMVDLRSNAYDWYQPVQVFRSAEGGRWDEPPSYPGLTNAYYQALETSKDRILESWGR